MPRKPDPKARKRHPLYQLWTQMLYRCENPRHRVYRLYGARGITVCDRWHDFDLFCLDMGPRPSGATLERDNNDLGYYPGNCVWATRKQQANNTRRNLYVEYRGERLTAAQLAERTGLDVQRIRRRLRAGLPFNHEFPPRWRRPERGLPMTNAEPSLSDDPDLITIEAAAERIGVEPKRIRGFILRNDYGDPIGDMSHVYAWSLGKFTEQPSV